jgi:DNA-binding MarR family transcriptional regulator
MDRITADWARELPDLDTRAIAVIGRLERATRLVEREIVKELELFELTIAEFNTLCALRRSGPPYRLSPKNLSDALLFSSGGLTKLLERLEARGLARREPDPNDGRGVLVCLTSEGKDLGERAMGAHRLNEEELLAPLNDSQRAALSDILRDLLVAFEAGVGRMRPVPHPARSQAVSAEGD